MDRRAVWGEGVFAFVDDLLEGDLHGKRVLSSANATLGVMVSASLAVAVIGRSLAQARGLLTKHAVKQVDRLLSNQAIDPWEIAARWVPEVIGSATDIQVAMDWTDFDADGQTTLNRPGFSGGHLVWVMRPRLGPRPGHSSALRLRREGYSRSVRAGGGC